MQFVLSQGWLGTREKNAWWLGKTVKHEATSVLCGFHLRANSIFRQLKCYNWFIFTRLVALKRFPPNNVLKIKLGWGYRLRPKKWKGFIFYHFETRPKSNYPLIVHYKVIFLKFILRSSVKKSAKMAFTYVS